MQPLRVVKRYPAAELADAAGRIVPVLATATNKKAAKSHREGMMLSSWWGIYIFLFVHTNYPNKDNIIINTDT
jgi:hypothetical protein